MIAPIRMTDHKRHRNSDHQDDSAHAESFDNWYTAGASNANIRQSNKKPNNYNGLTKDLRKPQLSVSNFLTATPEGNNARLNKLVSKADHYKALQRSDRRQYGFDFLYQSGTDQTL